MLSLRGREGEATGAAEEAWVEERVAAREAARVARDYELADAIRAEIERRGFILEDTPAGTRWKPAPGALAEERSVR